ncbi:MAG: glycosyltransferase [Chloroflexi bacterium]|nr:glycosyltransferase [Chloroflexota bacterium]
MHIAIGYHWFPTTTGNYLEHALRAENHTVTYVGLPCSHRPGYDSTVPLADLLNALPQHPDLYLWIDSSGRYFPPTIEDLPIPTACYLVDVHLGAWRRQAARFFDAVFIAQRDYLDAFRHTVGHQQVFWLPLAAALDVHRRMELPKIYEVGFVGNIMRDHHRTARVRRLRMLAAKYRTNDFFRSYTSDELSHVYSQSRIVFNNSVAGDVNMRIFEGTACGALMLTDAVRNGLDELFDIGREMAIFGDDEDLFAQIEYYLVHEEERAHIASAGYARTCAEHTYIHRVRALLDAVTRPTFGHAAPMRQATIEQRNAARRAIYTHLQMLDALLDLTRSARYNPLQRGWAALPCLLRRLIF